MGLDVNLPQAAVHPDHWPSVLREVSGSELENIPYGPTSQSVVFYQIFLIQIFIHSFILI